MKIIPSERDYLIKLKQYGFFPPDPIQFERVRRLVNCQPKFLCPTSGQRQHFHLPHFNMQLIMRALVAQICCYSCVQEAIRFSKKISDLVRDSQDRRQTENLIPLLSVVSVISLKKRQRRRSHVETSL